MAPLLAIALGTLLVSAPAQAQDADARRDAARLFERGAQALERCMYDEAVESFTEAYRLVPHHVIYYYLGLAHHRDGSISDALHFFRKYLYESEQVGDGGEQAQVLEVRRLVDELEKKVRADELWQRERAHRDSMHASVARLLDTLVNTHGEEVAAPYLHAYARVASRTVTNPRAGDDAVAELDRLEDSLRAELNRSPTRGSSRLQTVGATLTTGGLLAAGVGVGYGIAARDSDSDDAGLALRAMAYGGGGLLAAVLGWSIYKYGKERRKPPLLRSSISLSPGKVAGGSGILAAGSF